MADHDIHIWLEHLCAYSERRADAGSHNLCQPVRETITVIVPLSYIGSNFESYKYIIVAGSYDGYGVNGWRVVDQTNTTNGGWQGGGGNPPWSSNIYTYIAPATVGEGSLTQQQALSSFSATDHKYATLVPPISLPLLRNVTTTSHTQISPVENAYPQIYYSNGMYYMFYLSNATGTAELYVSTSSNAVNWSEPVACRAPMAPTFQASTGGARTFTCSLAAPVASRY